ncbi:MAG: flagellin [Micavibrio aeruginosavorus]|uniref:Flagellin n=1 Tax=Micavibrio aeruginosavorus TaxID=349221 RepID=A0A7T5R1P9_9BACT|nr:MAG: flagellin [Micavibrio aeruginosavorus]
MSNDVVLTAALRSNLLSLQNTQGLIDTTQYRLSTGRKVNSALDNPQSFFAAQALNNRASDLTRLLDGIGQSIQVIKAADNGITALTRLVEQADSVAKSARDALAAGQAEAKVTGSRDLRNIDDLTALPGVANGDILTFSLTAEDGTAVNIGAYGGATAATASVTINTNDSIDELIAEINNLNIDDGAGQALGDKAFEASLDDKGQLVIKTLNGGDFRLQFVSAAATDAADLALAADLGMGDVSRLIPDGAANSNNVEFSSLSDVALISFPLYNSGTGEIAQASSTLNLVENASGTPLFANIDNAADQFRISIDGGAVQNIDLFDGTNPISIQAFVDRINANSTLNTKVEASYDDTTGELRIEPIDGTVQSIEVGIRGDDAVQANFGFGLTNLVAGAGGEELRETIRLAAAAGQLAQLEKDFNNLRDQIDLLVTDTGYRGTNLLNGDDLLTVFNEDRSSSLTTEGVTFTASGLGMDEANFSRISSTEEILDQVRDALNTVRDFGNTLANDLSIIQTREDYSKNLINTLTEGSDKLTVADQNEEGAKLLALQTRQQLGVTALSLASQSQQSILRLFG